MIKATVPAAAALQKSWETDPRWKGVTRRYTAEDVLRLRGTLQIEHTLARVGAEKLWRLMHEEEFVSALSAVTGNQAVQQVQAGLKAIYISGWQVAADANLAQQTYPDQSLYPADSVPALVRRVNYALMLAHQNDHAAGKTGTEWFVPLVSDAEAGFGGNLNAFELMKALIEAGGRRALRGPALFGQEMRAHGRQSAGAYGACHRETDRGLAGGRHSRHSDRADAHRCIQCQALDYRDRRAAITRSLRTMSAWPRAFTRTGRSGGGHRARRGLRALLRRGLVRDVRAQSRRCPPLCGRHYKSHPGKLLAYNCSPSFNWKANLDDATIAKFQRELGAMGYKFQFVTLAGFHALNLSMFKLALDYRREQMAAYARLQEEEFALARSDGFAATTHQRFVGTGYFDEVQKAIAGDDTPPRP